MVMEEVPDANFILLVIYESGIINLGYDSENYEQ